MGRKARDPIDAALTAFRALNANERITFWYVVKNLPGQFAEVPPRDNPAPRVRKPKAPKEEQCLTKS